jgi:hypothetical protein
MYMQPEGTRKVARPLDRWKEVGKDVRMLEIRSLWAKGTNREERRKFSEKAKNLHGAGS